ncbi:MAG: hypothetical protein JXM69_00450 [Anaerolineae bacterium]|nr:hypothetical protein [Anaerolineae bacterium]
MPTGLHFEQLAMSEADAKALHRNAAYFEELDRVSKTAWDHVRFMSRKQYQNFVSRALYRHRSSSATINLYGPRGGSHYALEQQWNLTAVEAFANAQILSIVEVGSNHAFHEYQITFRNTKFFDFLHVGMAWNFYPDGSLCPACFCVESQVEIEKKSNFITDFQNARNLFGHDIRTWIYQCNACAAKWERTEYSWYADFTY